MHLLSRHHCCCGFISITKLHQHSFTHVMCDWYRSPCRRELFLFISPGNVSICAPETLIKSICDKMIAFWLSFHSLGFLHVWIGLEENICMFICSLSVWERNRGVCSSVCANEPLIFLICSSVCICLMNQILQHNISRLSARVCSYLCSCVCGYVLVRVCVFICFVHVSVHLSVEERSQEVCKTTQVGFYEVISLPE